MKLSESTIYLATADKELQTKEGQKNFKFGDVFFPNFSPEMALLSSFATWSIGFITRPLGALFFGWIGDCKGRKVVMVTTIMLIGISTAFIGIIPAYTIIGLCAPICLIILRFFQGFGAGAELSAGTIILAEYAPSKHRGLISSIIALGSSSGTLIASMIWLIFIQLEDHDLHSWGWRIPFLSSALITLIAWWVKQNLQETPVYQHKVSQSVLPDNNENRLSIWKKTKAFWIVVGLRIGENGPSSLCHHFIIGYTITQLMLEKTIATYAILIASLLSFIIVPFSGWLSDIFGRRICYRWFCLLLIIYIWPAFILLNSKDIVTVIVVIIIGILLASHGIYAVQAAWTVEIFGIKHRYTKMAFAKELGAILSGGIAPLIAAALLAYTKSWIPIAIYFSIVAGIGFLTTFIAPETRGRDLNLLKDTT